MKSEISKIRLVRLSSAQVIGKKIKELRTSGRLTQRELANRAGITQSTLALIESGKTNPKLQILDDIARGLNMEIAIGIRRKFGL